MTRKLEPFLDNILIATESDQDSENNTIKVCFPE